MLDDAGVSRPDRPRRPARPPARRRAAVDRPRPRRAGHRAASPGGDLEGDSSPERPGLRHLHLGLDRHARGAWSSPHRRSGQPHRRGGRGCSASRPTDRVLQFSLAQLRHRRRGALPGLGRGGGGRPPRRRDPRPGRVRPAGSRRERITVARPADGLLARLGRGPGRAGRRRCRTASGWWSSAARRPPASVYADWRALGGDRVRWINTYGPTEATVDRHRLRAGGRRRGGRRTVPIGRPIANTRVYVLDARMRPVAGRRAGRAVPRRRRRGPRLPRTGPALTAERFVPDPFGDRPGARLYRTGDLARWRPDGHARIPRPGRRPGQGPRLPGRAGRGRGRPARPAPASARPRCAPGDDGAGGLRWSPTSAGPGLDPDGPARRTSRIACPGTWSRRPFVTLPALPLTPSGKVDRRALPAPGRRRRRRDAPAASRRRSRRSSSAIWEEVLGVRPVGVTDDFFDLGGHSLLAIRLLARVEEGFGRRLAAARPVPRGDGRGLRRAPAGAGRSRAAGRRWCRSSPAGPGAPFFCVHPAGGDRLLLPRAGPARRPRPAVLRLQAAGLDAGGRR